MGLFDKLTVFYYQYIDDKVEAVQEVVGDKILGKALDHAEERIDRTLENWDAVLSDDPYIEGKENGYKKAAKLYENLFIELNKKNDEILKEARKLEKDTSKKVIFTAELLEKKKSELTRLKERKKEKCESIAQLKGYSLYQIEMFTLFPDNKSLLDVIASKKLREMKSGELNGFTEAKKMYDNKLEEQKRKFENNLNEIIEIKNEYVILYEKIIDEIKVINQQMIALEILEI